MKRAHAVEIQSFTYSHRRGWTLIELIVVMTVMATFAGSACVIMIKMLNASGHQAEALVHQRTWHLCQNSILQDGRAAQTAHVTGETPETRRLEFQTTQGTTAYQVIPGGIERSVNGRLAGRWELGSGIWSFTTQDNDRLIRVEFQQTASSDQAPSVHDSAETSRGIRQAPCRVEVALGTNLFQNTVSGAP